VVRWGYRTYYRASEKQMATDLATQAAEQALAVAGVRASELALIVLGISDLPEYLLWDASAALARSLDVKDVPTLLLTQGCALSLMGFACVAGALAIRPDADTALLVTVNRTTEAFRNRMRFNTCLGSDGAGAAVLRRGHQRMRWLATEQFTDPDLVDIFRLEYGGSACPEPPAGMSNLDTDALALIYEHFDRDIGRFRRFASDVDQRVALVIDRACQRAGVDRDQIARLIYVNDNQHSIRDIAEVAGIPVERTNAALAAELGHLGAADHLVCLGRHLERGDLAEGDIIAMAGISPGMHWVCTLLEI
jgi:3-oxoacyl-[acyl-carrier-protein] synthase III